MGRKKTDMILENVTIEAVAAEGNAIARVDGAVVFVPLAVPGDVVDIHVFRKKKNYMEGRIIRMVKPSERRLEPFCGHFGICGGCRWQILPYDMQLEAKRQQVYDQLVRIGHLDIPGVEATIGSERTRFYRNKLEFTFSNKRWILDGENPEALGDKERCGLGFHVGKFFDKVLDISHCSLQPEPSNTIRNFIRDYALEHGLPFYDIREKRGYLRNMIVRTTESGNVMLIVVYAYDEPETRNPMLDAVAESFPRISSLYYVINGKCNDSINDLDCVLYRGEDAIYETMEGLRFKIGPKSFWQTNSLQARRLYGVAREFAGLEGDETVYDLYTGTGSIALFVASRAAKVIGIEYVPEAIEDAKANAAANGIDNCEFYAGDMKDMLTEDFISLHGRPDVIILDPPRAGIHPDVAEVILNAAPKRIVYVSCNPASQARDLAILCRDYRVVKVQPVDMFPHTQHVENVCALERKEAQ